MFSTAFIFAVTLAMKAGGILAKEFFVALVPGAAEAAALEDEAAVL